MNSKVLNGISIALAVVVHAGVIGVLVATWDGELEQVSLLDEQEYFIAATVVEKNPHRERRRAEAERKRSVAFAARRLRQSVMLEPKPVTRSDPEPQIPVERDIESEPDPLAAPQVTEADRELMHSELLEEIGDRENARQAVTDAETTKAYAAQIRQDIAKNWASPPSARNGMQALLLVQLVPTGEVVNVTLEATSGNDAFDRSVILAVRKAGRFSVPKKPRVFEDNFREFTVLFRPENLRL